jgi:hypothetical protein
MNSRFSSAGGMAVHEHVQSSELTSFIVYPFVQVRQSVGPSAPFLHASQPHPAAQTPPPAAGVPHLICGGTISLTCCPLLSPATRIFSQVPCKKAEASSSERSEASRRNPAAVILMTRAHGVLREIENTFFFFGGTFTKGQAARRPPPKTRACLSQAPTKRGVCASLPAALLRLSTRPTSPPYPTPQLLPPPGPPPSPDPLVCDLQLASVAVSAARRDSASSHPGRAHFSLPRRTCVCARHTAAPQRCRFYF